MNTQTADRRQRLQVTQACVYSALTAILLWFNSGATADAQAPVTPPPFGSLPSKAVPAPLPSLVPSPATLAANVPLPVKEMNGVWALDGYSGDAVFLNGALKLINGSDDIAKITVKLNAGHQLVLSLTSMDQAAGDFILSKAADGSYQGTVVPGTKQGYVEKLVLRRIDPPKEADQPRPGLVDGKWICVSGYSEQEYGWEFRGGRLLPLPWTQGGPVKVKDGAILVFVNKQGNDVFVFYPVYLPPEHFGDPPKLVELRGCRVNGDAKWRMYKLVHVAR